MTLERAAALTHAACGAACLALTALHPDPGGRLLFAAAALAFAAMAGFFWGER